MPEGRNEAPGRVEADVAAGDVVICGDDVEDGAGAADAVGQEVDVVNAAFEDADSLLVGVVVDVVHARELLNQPLLVAAVGVDFCILGRQEIFNESATAVAGGAEDGVRCHDLDVEGLRLWLEMRRGFFWSAENLFPLLLCAVAVGRRGQLVC